MKNLCRKGKVQVHPSPNPAACRDAYSVLRLLPVAIAALSAALQAEDREVLAYFIARSLDVMPLPDKETKKNKRGGGGGGAAGSRKTAIGKHGEVEEDEGVPPWGGGGGGPAAVVRFTESDTLLQRSPSCSGRRKEVKNIRKVAPPQRNHPASFECSCFQCYTSFWSRWDASSEREIIHQAIDLFEEHLAVVSAEATNKARKSRKGSKPGKDDKNANNYNLKIVQEEKGKDEVFAFSEGKNERDEDSKPAPRSKQIVPVPFDFEEENEEEDVENPSMNNKDSKKLEEVRAGACPLEGRSLMRRMFPDIMGFVADHLWTAWSSPVRATNA